VRALASNIGYDVCFMRRLPITFVVLASIAGCVGRISSTAGYTGDIDAGNGGIDAWSQPGVDAWSPGHDAYVVPGTDAWSAPNDAWMAPPDDAWTPPPNDAWVDPACGPGTTPLSAPIANCNPPVPASTGDPAQDCVNRINQLRCQCQHLPPLMRWTAGEACANQEAMYDQQHMTAHAGFMANICASGYGENECPGWSGWSSIPMTVDQCLQDMWNEGPGRSTDRPSTVTTSTCRARRSRWSRVGSTRAVAKSPRRRTSSSDQKPGGTQASPPSSVRWGMWQS
jgi:hypothetical protein